MTIKSVLRDIGRRAVIQRPKGVVATISRAIVARRPTVTTREIAPTKLPAPNRVDTTPATTSTGGGGGGGIGFTGTQEVIEGNKLVATQVVVEGEIIAQFKPGEKRFTVNPNLNREVTLTFDRGVTRDKIVVSPTSLKGESVFIPKEERVDFVPPEDKLAPKRTTLKEDIKRLREQKKAGEITGLEFVVGVSQATKAQQEQAKEDVKRLVTRKVEKAREERIQLLEAGGVIEGLPSTVITETGEVQTFPSTVLRGATDEEIRNVLENPTFPGLTDRQAAAEVFILRTAKNIVDEERTKAQTEFSKFNEDLQSKINTGEIDLNKAVRQSEAKLDELNTGIFKIVENRTKTETKSLLNKSKLVQLPNVFAASTLAGFGVGGILLKAPRDIQIAAGTIGTAVATQDAVKLGAAIATGEAGLLDAATFATGFAGFIIGAKARSDLFEVIARAGKKSTARTRTAKLKAEDLKIEIKSANLKKTGVDLNGKPIFEANIEVVIKTINRNTKRVVDTTKTTITQEIRDVPTVEGATKILAEGLAATLRKSGIRKFLDEPKITITRDLKAAITTATFEVPDIPQVTTFDIVSGLPKPPKPLGEIRIIKEPTGKPIIRGRATTDILDVGFQKGKVTFKPGEIFFDVRTIKTKTPTKAFAIADIKTQEIGRVPAIRDVGRSTKVPGFEIVDKTKLLSEFTRETLRVKGFKREVPVGLGEGFRFEIPLDTKVQRIKPFVRRFPKEQIPKRDLTFEIGKTFFQEEGAIIDLTGMEFKPPKLPGVPKPKPAKVPKVPEFKFKEFFIEEPKPSTPRQIKESFSKQFMEQQQDIKQIMRQQQQTAIATSKVQAKGFIDTISQEILQQPRRLPKMVGGQGLTPKQLQNILGVQIGQVALAPIQISKAKNLERIIGMEANLVSQFVQPTIDITKVTKQQVTPISSQASGQLQSINTLNLLLAPSFTGLGKGFTDITKISKPIAAGIRRDDKRRRMEEAKQKELFDVWIKSQKRRIKVADNVSSQESLDIGSFIVDNSLSAEFKRKGSQKGKKKVPEIFAPPMNWNISADKFRQFRIKKGKTIPIKNTFIEKKQHRLDTPGEVAQITGARFFNQQRRKTSNILKTNQKVKKIFGF